MSKEVKKINDDDLDAMELVTLAEMANMAGEQAEAGMTRTVEKAADAGRYLEAAKRQCKHGEWLTWLGANWNYSQQTAAKYMRVANYTRGCNLKEVSSCNEALRLIYAEEGSQKRSSGATVEVVDPVKDPDPAPEPPTNRKTSKDNKPPKETDKPKTPPLTPEILDADDAVDPVDDWISCRSLEDVALRWLGEMPDAVALKSAAKHLRKLADKLDPPTKFVKPDLEDVSAYMHTLGDAIGKDVAAAADGFMDHYQSNGWMVGKVAMKDWRATARKWLKNQNEFSNGKANNNGHRTSQTPDPGSCLGPNGRPRIDRAKITYK